MGDFIFNAMDATFDFVADRWKGLGLLVLVLIVAIPVGYAVGLRSTQAETTFTVRDKLYHASGSGDGSYLVYTNKGVFSDEDSMIYWKFNSSDVYNQLERGKTYTCKTAGWRIPFFSSYRNIISCQ